MEHSDHVVVLDLGSVLASGLPDEIQHNQAVRDAYLGESG
jgi:branched-chain amino acid transport system ATP-binding protein